MHAFWDVLWSDTKGLAIFIAPMLLLTLPASFLGSALFGQRNTGATSQRRWWRPNWRVVALGMAAAVVLSMVLEFSLIAEGLPLGRRTWRDPGVLQLILLSPVTAFLAAYLAARRSSPKTLDAQRRRFTLRQLFLAQF